MQYIRINRHLILPWESEPSRLEVGLEMASSLLLPLQKEGEEEEEDLIPISGLHRGRYACHISPLYKDTMKRRTLSL